MVPDEKFTAIVVQNLYGKVFKRLKNSTVSQSYADLPDVITDQQVGIDGARFLAIDKFGDVEKLQFIANKKPEEDSFTIQDVSKLMLGIRKMLKKKPDSLYFGLLLYAGHGMIRDGVQNFVLNQFDKSLGFYKLMKVELDIRSLSST